MSSELFQFQKKSQSPTLKKSTHTKHTQIHQDFSDSNHPRSEVWNPSTNASRQGHTRRVELGNPSHVGFGSRHFRTCVSPSNRSVTIRLKKILEDVGWIRRIDIELKIRRGHVVYNPLTEERSIKHGERKAECEECHFEQQSQQQSLPKAPSLFS